MTFDFNFTDSYPVAKRSNHQHVYHGVTVPEPYDYMEDPDNPDTKKFVEDNNALFDRFIDKSLIKKYQDVFARYVGFSLYSLPSKHAGKLFFTKHDGKEPQGRFYSQDLESGKVKELFNFNTLSTNGTSSALITSVSPNGKFLATTVSKHGSDWQVLLVINLESGVIQESIPWVNFTKSCWLADSSAFYYTRFPDQTGLPLEERRRHQKVFYHILGSDFNHDPVVYDPMDKDFTTNLTSSSDHQWLIYSTNNSTMPQNKLFLQRVGSTDPPIEVITELDGNSYKVIDIIDQTVYCLTSWDAPNKKLMKFTVDSPAKDSWTEVIPENSSVLVDVQLANHSIILIYIEDVKHVVYRFTLEGQKMGSISLPGDGSIIQSLSNQLAIYSQIDDTEVFFTVTTFFDPPTIYRYDFTTEKMTVFFSKPLSIDTSMYVVKQIFFSSKDGTKIPMFIMHHKDITLDGNNKTILYGYGGYNISLLSSYVPRYLAWLEQGGVYAVANLRGGGEYGKNWHYQGILEHKQNVFDDFIGAAEWLIQNKYTTTKKLAIDGRSNGGLLVGACLVQRPDLFGVAVPEVGVLDMLRFKYFQAGRFWTAEYGDAEANEEHFKFLMKYSPLHNVSKHSQYPPTLVVAAEADDRVVPMHTKKFTAALQHVQQAKNPILMRIETKTGHGFGKSTQQQIADNAFVFAFIEQIFSQTD